MRRPSIFEVATAFEDGQEGVMKQQDDGPYETYKTLSKSTKILLVDDSLINRALLTDILSDEYTIVEAENGKTAIKIIQEDYNELSLILLDLSMPEVDGYEVLKFLNESDYIKNLPVIIISAETSPEKIKDNSL